MVSHVFCSPGPLTSLGKGEGHMRAHRSSTSLAPLCLSPGEPEMDTKCRVLWVTGNSTKFSKTLAGGWPACSEPNPAPSGLDFIVSNAANVVCAWASLWLHRGIFPFLRPGSLSAILQDPRLCLCETWVHPHPPLGLVFHPSLPHVSGSPTAVPLPWPTRSSRPLGQCCQPSFPRPWRAGPELRSIFHRISGILGHFSLGVVEWR